MKPILLTLFFLLAHLCRLNAQVDLTDSKNEYHSGFGVYPIAFYEMGHSIKYNYILTKKNHDFYIGFSTHINYDTERWRFGNAFRSNGIVKDFNQFFHPNIGYTKYITFAKGYPVSLVINPDFQFGNTYLNTKWYTYNPEYNSAPSINDGRVRVLSDRPLDKKTINYYQFTFNLGLKIDLTKQIQVNTKVGLGFVKLKMGADNENGVSGVNGFEFPIVYSIGVNYIFRK